MLRLIFLLCLSLTLQPVIAQTVTLLGDLVPGSASSVYSESNTAIAYKEMLYFAAETPDTGVELMIYDGTEVRLMKDISPGSASSNPRNFYEVNGILLFTANDGEHGYEWWRTDGTEAGTQLVSDIFPGLDNGVWTGNSDPFTSFHSYGNELLFVGLESKNNFELWKTDGTSDGTVLVKNIAADNTSFNQPSFPEGFVDFKNEVYFSCREGFWKTDGTTDGTLEIKSDHPTDVFGFTPGSLYATEEQIFMLETPGVWVTDGTKDGTINIATLGQVNVNWNGNRFNQVGDVVLFPGADEANGNELWRSDGTEEGTFILKDLWEGPEGYAPQNTVVFNGKLIYKGNDGTTGQELYMSDGTAEGTGLLKEIKSGSSGSFFLPTNVVADANYVYFNAGKSFTKKKLWQSDGTAEGTIEVLELGEAETPFNFYLFDEKLFFFAMTDERGWEPYIYDPFGTVADADNDGFNSDEDCDDSNAAINPQATEIPFNELDDDCNPATVDNDGDQDGFPVDEDCDDTNPDINPDATEIPNNDVDENCDGEIGTSSILEANSVKITLSPNPASDYIFVQVESGHLEHYHIYDSTGRIIIKNQSSKQINVQNLTEGIYFIELILISGQKINTKFLVY